MFSSNGIATGNPLVSQQLWDTPGTYSWVCPPGVTSVCACCIGSGGQPSTASLSLSAGGGGLGWKNNIAVTPGTAYTVVVSDSSGNSYFISLTTVAGKGGTSNRTGGSYVGSGGGTGGMGGATGTNTNFAGGGGAGGYSGAGGAGASADAGFALGAQGTSGAAGGGAGGSNRPETRHGGGTGIKGQGANGVGTAGTTYSGQSGSGGTDPVESTRPGRYGGGSGSYDATAVKNGAVRLIWGAGRAYPSTKTGDM